MELELRDEERLVLETLNKIQDPELYAEQLPGALFEEYQKRVQTRPLVVIEDLHQVFESMDFSCEMADVLAADLVEHVYEQLLTTELARVDNLLWKYARRTENRTLYNREPVYTFYKNGEVGHRWRHDRLLRSFGLISLISKELVGQVEEPIALSILKSTELKDEEGDKLFYKSLDEMNSKKICVSGERLGWNMLHPSWAWLVRAFPAAIDMAAYNHSVNAPVVPEGFFQEIPVEFKVLRNDSGQDLETDGSGIYNPNHEMFKGFVAKYGAVPFQFRMLDIKSGMFAKGTVFPSDRCERITLDWGQVKGMWKSLAKTRRASDAVAVRQGCYLGILQVWDRPRRIAGSFEMLENVKTTPRTVEIVQGMVDKAMNRLLAKGAPGLLASIAKKDSTIRMIIEICNVMRNSGLNIDARQIPRVQAALRDRLGRVLYQIAQGGGGKFPSYVARLDATIPRGKCVVSGIRPGRKVAAFRFPMILSQGLVVMETIKPAKHLLCNGELPPYQVVMNPLDLTLKMQGDDDGDILGVTTSPEMIELFENRLDEDLLHIEPKGVPLLGEDGQPLRTESTEGLKYLQTDHRAHVGRCTVWRAELLAVGDLYAARAMSVAIQECIDRAKRMPEWSNIEEAADPNNWVKENGEWKFHMPYAPEDLEEGEFPIDRVEAWVDSRLIEAGCIRFTSNGEIAAGNPLWWRERGKRLNYEKWFIPAPTEHENLVHVAARHAKKLWEEAGVDMLKAEQINIRWVLRTALELAGHKIDAPTLDYKTYQRGLRAKSGLTRYCKRVSEKDNEEDRLHTLEADLARDALSGLGEDLNLYVQIWEAECSEEGNLNNAFRITTFQDSPVLKALGIKQPASCDFLNKNGRLDWVVKTCLEAPNPAEKLSEVFRMSTKHQQEHFDSQKRGIPMWECPDCTKRLQDVVVAEIRGQKSSSESRWLAMLTKNLNGRESV